MNEYYKTNEEKQKKTYACFVKTPEGMFPVGQSDSKEESIGILVSALEEMLVNQASDSDDEILIAFMPPDYAYGSDFGSGIRIEAVSKKKDPTLTAFYEDDFDSSKRFGGGYHLTGYALIIEGA